MASEWMGDHASRRAKPSSHRHSDWPVSQDEDGAPEVFDEGEAGDDDAGDLVPAEPSRQPRPVALAALRGAIRRIEGQPACRMEEPDRQAGGARTKENDPTIRAHVASSGSASFERLSLGLERADRLLGGGFPAAALSEIRVDAVRDGGAALGFALALAALFGASARRPVIWIAAAPMLGEAGWPYRPGLAGFGLDPDALVMVRTRRLDEAAWAAEEAVRSGAAALTLLELQGNPARLSLEGTRRLQTRARDAGRPVLLLRQGAFAESTAAPLRLHVAPHRAAPVPGLADPRLIGPPRFRLAVEKSRDGRPDHMLLEWNRHDRRFLEPAAALPGASAAAPVDGPDPARASGPVVAWPGARRAG
ncbi:ImuA family protein [Aureimonas pseudogalii]|uniref:Protein ImuA n=1 Tax=Aureimonas pseudogalii TaxID=1744844 RepID=A0A7W6E932_9HYPH|nr:hypothetical protein [Aureimonas pseudogalii]MBB3996519.1 protein ImuA [Aureimonas pseudogalii]